MDMKTIAVKRENLAVLLLHMATMRDSIKKGFKRNYGLLEGRKKIKIYDDVKNVIEQAFVQEQENVSFNKEQYEMISSFLEWYLQELKKQVEKEKMKMNNDTYLALNEVHSLLKTVV
jgi:DNA-binding protein Fis